jgi:hypothetical protein
MALVNPNIAMSFRQPDIQAPNALAQYAQLQQIQGGQQAQELARFQLGAAQRAEGVQNALTNAYASSIDPTGNIDYNRLIGSLAKGGGASQIPSVLKTKAETTAAQLAQKKTQGEIDKNQFDLQDKKLKFAWNAVGASTTPEAAIAELTKGVKDGIFDMKSTTDEIKRVQNLNPEQYRQYRIEKVMGILDAKDKLGFMLPKVERQDIGGQIVNIQANPTMAGYGQPIAGAAITKTPTIGETTAQQQLRVSQGQLSLAQQRLLFDQQKEQQPQFNAQAGGFIAPPTRENPQGVFIPAKDIQASKDQSAAVRALRSAGYDVETGEDTISKLIAKSTSGGLQAAGAGTLAFFGKSTEGRNAIAALEGTANQIATDLAGGKLGAGISNTDRDFIVGALGDVANPSKTSEERLAGWTAAKNRMMLTGLIPPPKGAGAPTAPVAPVKITGDADYNKLPSGSLFIGPDGQQRRKP